MESLSRIDLSLGIFVLHTRMKLLRLLRLRLPMNDR